ncbi:kinase-like domain-containing protein [Biscogniauxia sp. FL1348]|nr:kinase-like domain-containing protein [Biscogniauxia sp. FL1348]
MAANIKILAAIPEGRTKANMVRVRFLVDGKTVKYGYISVCAFHEGWWKPDEVDNVVLPDLPKEWTWVCIVRHYKTGEPYVRSYHNRPPKCIEVDAWHSDVFEYAEIQKINLLQIERFRKEDRMWLVQHPTTDKQCLMKIAEVPKSTRDVKSETDIYRALEGSGIAPQFMGHVAEQGRVMGFLIEWIEGAAHPDMEHDMERVKDALKKLHALGIVHKDPHAGNFLVKDDRVYIIDFEHAHRTNNPDEFAKEMGRISGEHWLWQLSSTDDDDES